MWSLDLQVNLEIQINLDKISSTKKLARLMNVVYKVKRVAVLAPFIGTV